MGNKVSIVPIHPTDTTGIRTNPPSPNFSIPVPPPTIVVNPTVTTWVLPPEERIGRSLEKDYEIDTKSKEVSISERIYLRRSMHKLCGP